MADEIIIKYTADVSGLKADLKTVQTELKNTEKVGVDAADKTSESFQKTTDKTKSLKTQLKELKAQLANATDPKDIERLAKAAGKLTDQLQDATDAAKVFASESKFEQIGNAFGSVLNKVKSLDFKGALDQSKLLLATAKGLTFKEAIGGLKDIAGTVKNIGQAILTSPLFLIGGAIAGAVMVFNDLEATSARVNQTYLDGLDILKQSRDASEAYRKAQRDLAVENKLALGEISDLEANRLKTQNKFQDEYKKLLLERQTREKEALAQAEKDREEDGFRRTKQLYEFLGGETDATKAQKQKLKDIEQAFNNSVKDLNLLFREEDKKGRIADDNAKIKEREELNKRLIEEEERLRRVLRDLQTQNIADGYEREKQTLLNKFDDDVKQYKNNAKIRLELERKLGFETADLNTKYGKVKIDQDGAIQSRLLLSEEHTQNEIVDLTAENNLKIKQLNEQAADDQAKLDDAELQRRIKNFNTYLSTASTLINGFAQIFNDNANAEIQKNEDVKNENLSILQEEYDNKLISQEIYEARKKKIEDEALAVERDLKKEQFERNKQIAIINATIATAQAVTGALAQTAELGYGAIILAGLMAVLGAAQIGAIASQPTPKFEKGGWIDGKRHSQGGTLIEAEKDEFVINRNDARKNADLLEAINSGTANEFINQKFIAPILREQERKHNEYKENAFADSIVNSMLLNSGQFKDANLLEALKRNRQSDRENTMILVKELSKRTHNSRSW